MRRTVMYPLVLLAVVILAAPVSANQLDLFGFNAQATALANAYTAFADGPEAAFYNPGALIESHNVQALFGYSFSIPAVSTDLLEANGGNKSDTEQAKQARGFKPSQWLNAGVSGGLYDRVFLGLNMQLPVDGYPRSKIFSPDHPYYLKYDTGVFGMTIVPAVGVLLAPNFGLGVSARVTLDSLGSFESKVPINDGKEIVSTYSDSHFTGQFAPIFGFYARSHEFLRFGLTYRGASYSYFHKTVRETLVPEDPNGFVEIEYEARYNYQPRMLNLGIVGTPEEHISITAEMSWVGWSSYEAPFPKVRMDFTKMARAGLDYQRPEKLQAPKNLNFSDVFVTRFAVEPRVNKYLVFRAGYAYEPSPVPDQDGTTTIIDSTTHVIAFGMGSSFGGPNGDLVSIDVAVMDHIMASKTIQKSADQMQEAQPEHNPAYPRLDTSGQYIYSAMSATFRF